MRIKTWHRPLILLTPTLPTTPRHDAPYNTRQVIRLSQHRCYAPVTFLPSPWKDSDREGLRSRRQGRSRSGSTSGFAENTVRRSISLWAKVSLAPSILARRWWIPPSRPSAPASARRLTRLKKPRERLRKRWARLLSQRNKRQKMRNKRLTRRQEKLAANRIGFVTFYYIPH